MNCSASRRGRIALSRRDAQGAVQADRAGRALQAARLTHGGDQKGVVRGGGDAEVELVVPEGWPGWRPAGWPPPPADDYGWGTTNGTAVAIWTCTGQPNQQWKLNPDGTITSVHSGLCPDVSGAGTANGTKVQLWTCGGGANQEWNLG